MKRYLLRRLSQVIPTMLGASIIVFLIINAAPGNPMSYMINPYMTSEAMEARERQLGLDKPLPHQYGIWLSEVVTKGNLGYSTRYRRPVVDLIKSRLGATLVLTISAMLVSFIIAIPIGVFSATHQYSRLDYFFVVIAIAGVSIPVFFLGLAMIKIFAFDLRWFPAGGMVTPGMDYYGWFEYAIDVGKHLVLPVFVLACAEMAKMVRYVRSSMLEVIRQDYLRTARSKGLSEQVVIYKHALRNAMIPVITVMGLSLPFLFSGAILTEAVFNWPGMGTLNLTAVHTRDYPLIMGINLFMASLVILGNMLADVFYAVADPRIRYD